MSAQRGSGKAAIFDKIGDLFIQLGNLTTDSTIANNARKVAQLRKQIDSLSSGITSQGNDVGVNPNKELRGRQQAQAEEVFNAVLSSMPPEVQKRVRENTRRMSPGAKLAYIKRVLGEG